MIAAGAVLRAVQYFAGASQWVDELALSRAFVGLPWTRLLASPLPYGQLAPKGFVLLEKAAVTAFGAGDLALRLVPFAASLAALELFRRLAGRLLARPAAVAFALALFALQPLLVAYSAQVKPYACDVAVALALTLIALDPERARPDRRRALLLAAAGILAVALSNAAVLVLAGLGVALMIQARRMERGLAAVLGTWAAAAAGAALWARQGMTPLAERYLASYWAPAVAPRPHTLPGDLAWLVHSLVATVGEPGT
ncbi:MAG TPA: hypothetical protein VGE98_05575, partial [Thermoanaerobaculia bacterium]